MSLINFNLLSSYHTRLKKYLDKIAYVHPETHPASMIVQDKFNKFVTSSQIERWNNKLDADANATSASKLLNPVNINGVPFDGTSDIEIKLTNNYKEVSFNCILEANQTLINVPSGISLIEDAIIYIFSNGVKLTKSLYDIDISTNTITLKTQNDKRSEIEVILTNIPAINYISGILSKGTKDFSFITNLPISASSIIYVFVNGIKFINKIHYSINFDSKIISFVESFENNCDIEIIISKE